LSFKKSTNQNRRTEEGQVSEFRFSYCKKYSNIDKLTKFLVDFLLRSLEIHQTGHPSQESPLLLTRGSLRRISKMTCVTLKRRLELEPIQSPRGLKRRRHNAPLVCTSPEIPPNRNEIASPFRGIGPPIQQEAITANLHDQMRLLQKRNQLQFGGGNVETSATKSIGFPSPRPRDESEGPPSPSAPDKPLFTFGQVGLICERLIRERENQLREIYEQALSNKLSEQYDTFVKFTHDQIQKRFEANAAPSYLS